MTRTKALFVLVPFALVVGAVILFVSLPKHYRVGENMVQTIVFWDDKEAFLFLTANTTGQSSNFVQEKLAKAKYGYLTLLLARGPGFHESSTTAYHLLPSGEMQRFALPAKTASYGTWTLVDGRLQLTPAGGSYSHNNGFRWDDEKFVIVPLESMPQAQVQGNTQLDPDDTDTEDDEGPGYFGASTRKMFKNAGWHYKMLSGYVGKGADATLPIQLGNTAFALTIHTFPLPTDNAFRFDMVSFGAKSIEISGDGLSQNARVLWSQTGWHEISKNEFNLRVQQSGRTAGEPVAIWVWLAVLLLVGFWKFYGWLHVFFSFFTMKGRVLKNMATSYSFPPATTAQFPLLDTAALESYTREFESIGFTRLLDLSLVSDAPNHPPNFCRLFANTRYHCFGEVNQIFPRGKAAMPLKCSIQSSLTEGWSIAFSSRKPQAASSLMRRKKALGIGMPDATPSELLRAFLKMRDQVCMDLGISPLKDDSFEAYIAKVQQSVSDMRTAVSEKNFAAGLSQVYFRKLALLKSKPEYVWLGDYPKEAERRRQGYTFGASPA